MGSTHILKELGSQLSYSLHIIFNMSLEVRDIPDDWKNAQITAIYKKGSHKLANNYRLVSLPCITCEILESIVRDAIFSHMTTNHFFSKKQFGIITKRSTILQLLTVLNTWTTILDNNGNLDNIYMDFMKAFDTVLQNSLLHKIY